MQRGCCIYNGASKFSNSHGNVFTNSRHGWPVLQIFRVKNERAVDSGFHAMPNETSRLQDIDAVACSDHQCVSRSTYGSNVVFDGIDLSSGGRQLMAKEASRRANPFAEFLKTRP